MSIQKRSRCAVYSESSSIHIKSEHFPNLIRTLKVYKKDCEELQKSISIWGVLKAYHCTASFDENGITSIRLKSEKWDTASMIFFSVLSRYAEPGGYIRIIDENQKTSWVYRFTKQGLKRNTLVNRNIDFQDEEDLLKNFKDITNGLYNLGKSKIDLVDVIKRIYIKNILG